MQASWLFVHHPDKLKQMRRKAKKKKKKKKKKKVLGPFLESIKVVGIEFSFGAAT